MKSVTGNAEPIKQGVVTPQEAIRYVLSLPIASLVSRIDSAQILKAEPGDCPSVHAHDRRRNGGLRARVAMYAMDGRFELFKSTNRYDGRIGREQHGIS